MKTKSGFKMTEPGWLMQNTYYETNKEEASVARQNNRNPDSCFDSYMIKCQNKGRER